MLRDLVILLLVAGFDFSFAGWLREAPFLLFIGGCFWAWAGIVSIVMLLERG